MYFQNVSYNTNSCHRQLVTQTKYAKCYFNFFGSMLKNVPYIRDSVKTFIFKHNVTQYCDIKQLYKNDMVVLKLFYVGLDIKEIYLIHNLKQYCDIIRLYKADMVVLQFLE